MKTRSLQGTRPAHGGSIAAGSLLAFGLLVAATATGTRAAVPVITYTASGQHVALGYPGDRLALPGGEQLRNQLQILAVDSTDVRLAGRRILLTHESKQADGTSELSGSWIGEPGTWVAGVFTPSGGLWDGNWRGTRQADGSLSMTLTARGIGGGFDGLELKETLARAAGPEFDPALRHAILGRTAPANGWSQTIFEDDFEDGAVDPAWRQPPGGDPPKFNQPRLEERDGELTLYLDPTTEDAVDVMIATVTVGRTVSLQDGQTLELRLDLARMTGSTSQLRGAGPVVVETFAPEGAHGYSATVMPVVAILNKHIDRDMDVEPHWAAGSYYRPGLTLILSVTRSNSTTALLRFRVVDRNRNGAVVYNASWTDTPAADPVMDGSDIAGPPYLSFIEAGLFLGWVPTTPQSPPKDVSLTIDNFGLRVFESSPAELQIERAVLLVPPSSTQPIVVEGAPTIRGPWTALSAPEVLIQGVRHLLVPVSETPGSAFFRTY